MVFLRLMKNYSDLMKNYSDLMKLIIVKTDYPSLIAKGSYKGGIGVIYGTML